MALTIDYWDSIDIGRPELNHSQGFFRQTHTLHEKKEIAEAAAKKQAQHQNNKQPVKAKISAATANVATKQNKSNKENVPSNSHSAASSTGHAHHNRAILAVSIVQKSKATTSTSNNVLKSVLKKSMSTSASSSNLNNAATTAAVKNDKPRALIKQNTAPITKLYEVAAIQKKKKEELAQKLQAEAEKEMNFKFHAKPAPKFLKAPTIQPIVKQQSLKEKEKETKNEEAKKKLMKQQSMPNLQVIKRPIPVVPACGDPERIRLMEEHKKRLLEKYKQDNVQFKAKPASVLQKPVFQPKRNFKAIDSKPFKLVLTQRLIQRSTFDKQLIEAQAIKKKQEEIIQRQHDLEERRQMRHAREFRANPNPFGRH